MKVQQNVAIPERQPQILALSQGWGEALAPLCLAIAACIILVFGSYLLPLRRTVDIGAGSIAASGLHAPEANERFSFAYTDGNGALQLPHLGAGTFVARLRAGGPNETVAANARLGTTEEQIDLGTVEQMRTYHLLVETDKHGSLPLHLRSTTTRLPEDNRLLGLVLDWIEVRPLGTIGPPVSILFSTPIVLGLAWLAILQAGVSRRGRLGLLLVVSILLCASVAGWRGRLNLQPWWLGGALSVALAMFIGRVEQLKVGSTLRVVATIFLAWRVALWALSAIGVWFSPALYGFGKSLTHHGAIEERSNFAWKALAASWMQWDAAHYAEIALEGYTFWGERWPTIAFFPLYPLLIRALLPITGNNTAVAALVVSHVALFAALLLLYDLLARDFNPGVAFRTTMLLLAFPTAFFFVAGYSEALGLALLAGSIWAMRRQRWWLAGALGGLLALTRLAGVMIGVVLVVAYLQHNGWRWRAVRPEILAALLPPLALGLFMLYQWQELGTPFAFLIAQRNWQQQLSPPWLMPGRLLASLRGGIELPVTLFRAAIWISFVGLTAMALRRLPATYGLTALLFLLPAYLIDRSWSLPRYILVGFPAFAGAAMLTENLWTRRLILAILLPLLAIATMLFVNGFWVA